MTKTTLELAMQFLSLIDGLRCLFLVTFQRTIPLLAGIYKDGVRLQAPRLEPMLCGFVPGYGFVDYIRVFGDTKACSLEYQPHIRWVVRECRDRPFGKALKACYDDFVEEIFNQAKPHSYSCVEVRHNLFSLSNISYKASSHAFLDSLLAWRQNKRC